MFGRRHVRDEARLRPRLLASGRPPRPPTVGAAAERLEPRRLFCGQPLSGTLGLRLWSHDPVAHGTAGAAAVTAATTPAAAGSGGAVAENGLPLLHSLPGAPTAVFLDFDGHVGEFREDIPYDTDEDPSTFSAAEQADIREAWRHVASYFSVFNTNVTTVPPSVPYSYSVITNSVAGVGYSYGGFPTEDPRSFNPSADARTRRSGIAHEVGHNFGLEHQSDYDLFGEKLREYSSGYDSLRGPIMGVDYAGEVHKWFIGHPSDSPNALQDDVAEIAGRIREIAGGDGMRPDDYVTSLRSPHALAGSGGVFAASGVIERLYDFDTFSFTSRGGRVQVGVVPPEPSMLDAKVELYTSGGTLIAAADGPTNEQHLDFPSLPAGTYVAVVRSHGDYGDLGPYDLKVVAHADGAAEEGYNGPHAPRGVTIGRGAGTGLTVSWDAVPGAAGYVVERSSDGAAWAQVSTTAGGGGGASGITDGKLDGGRRYFYRVSAIDGAGGRSAPSAVAHLVTRPSAVSSLEVTSWRPDQVILNWRDVSGEAGYRIERQVDASAGRWVEVGTVGANVPSFTAAGLSPGTAYRFRVVATGPSGDSAAAEAGGVTRLPAAGALAFTAREPNRLAIAWDTVPGATTYRVQRSLNSFDYDTVATLPAGATSYEDRAVQPLREYYYRVVPVNPTATGLLGTIVLAATPVVPAQVPPPPWSDGDVGDVRGAGATGYAAGGNGGTFTVIAGGEDVRGDADAFHYTYRPLAGDGEIVARVATQEYTSGAAAAGVMIRESLDPGARHAAMLVTTEDGTNFRYRTGPGGETENDGARGPYAPYWVRLVRRGNLFIGYRSADGAAWVEQERTRVPMGRAAYVGLAAAAGDDAKLASVTFTDVAVTGGPPAGDATPPQLVSAASTKRHGGRGTYDLPLLLATTRPTVEPRRGGASTLTFVFSEPVFAADGLIDAGEFVVGGAAFSSASSGFTAGGAFTLTLNLAGLADGRVVTVALRNLRDAAGNALAGDPDVSVRSLCGDVDGSARVDATDVAAVRAAAYSQWGGGHFLLDLDASGSVDALDFFLARRNVAGDPSAAGAA